MNAYIESESSELKETFTPAIVRELVAFLNASGGTIYIGVKDDGTVVGVTNIDETLRKLSGVITCQIEPNPQDEITSQLLFEQSKTIIAVNIRKGYRHIYCVKKYGFSSNGCLIRIGTTCKKMTEEQIKIRYEQKFSDTEYMLKKPATFRDLTFRQLKIYYAEKGFHLDDASFETNFCLKNDAGNYNLLAELLADRNTTPLIFVKFKGNTKASISERSDYGYGCLLTSYSKIKARLQAENVCMSNTLVRPRSDTFLYNENCVNEALLNALVHNDWTITEPQISMFNNRLEILSHGGLPGSLTKEQFFSGISMPRNATLMRIFLMLGLTEHTGHGVPTIVKTYGKEVFDIQSNYIKCTIPFEPRVLAHMNAPLSTCSSCSCDEGVDSEVSGDALNKTQGRVLRHLLQRADATVSDLALSIGVSRRTIERALRALQDKQIVQRMGTRRAGSWLVLR